MRHMLMTPRATRKEGVMAPAYTEALRQATALALLGPTRSGNPRVGCVIINDDGEIIAQGYHRGAGTPHAEADAVIYAQSAGVDLSGATAVVTLEPCNHTGRMPPCSHLLADSGISRVIYAVADPNPVAVGGAGYLSTHGVETLNAHQAGIDHDVITEAENVSATWRAASTRGRPWVIAKIAQSVDGFVAAADGTSQWITSSESRQHAHHTRADVDAIVVGTGTVLADDPALTARPDGVLAEYQPRRIVVGHRDIAEDARIWSGQPSNNSPAAHHFATHDITEVLSRLFEWGDRHVLLEGGPTLINAALAADVVDELHIYTAPILLGDGTTWIGPIGVQTLADARGFTTSEITQLGHEWFVRLTT